MPITPRKLNRPIRKAAAPVAKRNAQRQPARTFRPPVRKAASPYDKDLIEFANMLRNLGDTATDVSKELEKLRGLINSGDTEAVLTKIDVLDEEIAYDIREAVKTILDDEGGDGVGDLFNRIRDSLDATGTGQEDYEAAAKPRFTKRAARPAIRKAGDVDIDGMLDGYMEAALWSTMDGSDESGGEPLDSNYSTSDIDDKTKAKMREDCEAFVSKAGELLDKAEEKRPEYIGHEFWLTRNGHGAGFWDTPEDWGGKENANAISDIARKFREVELYVGDDGKIYQGGAE